VKSARYSGGIYTDSNGIVMIPIQNRNLCGKMLPSSLKTVEMCRSSLSHAKILFYVFFPYLLSPHSLSLEKLSEYHL
jgi:hypothetical protein